MTQTLPAGIDQRTADAALWLHELFAENDGYVRLLTIDSGEPHDWEGLREGRGPFWQVPSRSELLDGLAESMVQASARGVDTYCCPYPHERRGTPGGRRAGGATTRRHAHADIDGPVDLAEVRALGAWAVASGSTAADGTPHGHVYVRLTESVPEHVHTALCRALGPMVGGAHHDRSKVNDNDVLRPPGTVNQKPGGGPVSWLIRPNEPGVRTWEPEALARLLGVSWPMPEPGEEGTARGEAQPGEEPAAAVAPSALGEAARRVDGLVRRVREAERGDGNNALNHAAYVCGALCATASDAEGLDPAEVRERLVRAYLERPSREPASKREREARATGRSGWESGAADPARALADRRPQQPAKAVEEYLTMTMTEGQEAAEEEAAGGPTEEPQAASKAQDGGRRLVVTRASDIAPRRVEWMWNGRMALGTLSLLAGREGLGKSTLTAWLIARATRGELPGDLLGTPRSVIIAATEDSWEHTLVPRLMAAGADLSRVLRVEVSTALGFTSGLNLPTDIPAVTELIRAEDVGLLVLDPIMSRLEKLDTHKDAEVRQALEPLVAMADETRSALLGLIHLNKSSTDPLNAVMGSKAFTAVARSVSTVVADAEDETDRRRLFGTVKNNLGPDEPASRVYTVETAEVAGGDQGRISVGALKWQGSSRTTIKSAMSDPTGEARTAVGEAVEWLRQYLTDQPGAERKNIMAEARTEGHTESTVKRAAKRLEVVFTSTNTVPRRTLWNLPEVQVPTAGARGLEHVDQSGQRGALQSGHVLESRAVEPTGLTGADLHKPSDLRDGESSVDELTNPTGADLRKRNSTGGLQVAQSVQLDQTPREADPTGDGSLDEEGER